MITAVRKLWFCAGHRVLGHESKCANLHGHNYNLFVHARPGYDKRDPDALDDVGRVVDFSVLKELLGNWIDENWDHTTLLYEEDSNLLNVASAFEETKPVFICYFNPTAENMASYLLNSICPMLFQDYDIEVYKIVLWETDNCYVEAEL